MLQDFEQAIVASDSALKIQVDLASETGGILDSSALETILFMADMSYKIGDCLRSNEHLSSILIQKFDETDPKTIELKVKSYKMFGRNHMELGNPQDAV